ncbi:hypothetical protein TgHK011_000635 [Trichoderma gracile]|nr:hypothetical protein TgHK011_000635 [Trichoderma gracile]
MKNALRVDQPGASRREMIYDSAEPLFCPTYSPSWQAGRREGLPIEGGVVLEASQAGNGRASGGHLAGGASVLVAKERLVHAEVLPTQHFWWRSGFQAVAFCGRPEWSALIPKHRRLLRYMIIQPRTNIDLPPSVVTVSRYSSSGSSSRASRFEGAKVQPCGLAVPPGTAWYAVSRSANGVKTRLTMEYLASCPFYHHMEDPMTSEACPCSPQCLICEAEACLDTFVLSTPTSTTSTTRPSGPGPPSPAGGPPVLFTQFGEDQSETVPLSWDVGFDALDVFTATLRGFFAFFNALDIAYTQLKGEDIKQIYLFHSFNEMSPTSQSGFHTGQQSYDGFESTLQESSSDLDSCSDESEDEDELSMVVQSPTKLAYNIHHLPQKEQDAVRDVFGEPPAIALQQCRLIDKTYAFQMTELVTRSVRIHATDEGASRITCSCGRNEGDAGEPCSHLFWLLDRLTKQMLYDYDAKTPLTMSPAGYAEELGDPFTAIAEHHLDVVSAGLHCQVIDPDSVYGGEGELAAHRVQESRELLAAVYGMSPDEFRPDLCGQRLLGKKKVVKRNDLDCTVLRMLLDNPHFFDYFQSAVSRPQDAVSDALRKLSQRIDRVLRRFDAYAADPASAGRRSAETPPDVSWAAKHILGCIKLIRNCIFTRNRPLQPSEEDAAARTLVHILSAVVARNHDVLPLPATSESPLSPSSHHAGVPMSRTERNLYLRLIGDADRDADFILAELGLIPEAASQHLHTLEAIFEDIGMQGAPVGYFEKFKALLGRLRGTRRRSSGGLKRQGDGEDEGGAFRESKRMK